ncbi:MAG TPA: hypothetical protein VNL13_00670 [Sulfolobales archaeon]|nr:hypothetical protein [Sulfolobales archaeon]
MGYPPSDEGRDRDSRGEVEVKRSMMWGVPHSYEPEKIYEGELWVEITPNGWRPMIWDPMKGALRHMKPRGRAVDTKQYQSQ